MKKMLSTGIFFLITVIVYGIVAVCFSYTTEPEVTRAEFPFVITYEYKGVTTSVTGVFECKYGGSETTYGEHNRFWDGEARYLYPETSVGSYIIEQNDDLQTSLSVQANLHAGYFMGDPLYKDYYQTDGQDSIAPYVEYYDYRNEICMDENNREEILEAIGFQILDFTYGEPIENSFSRSGIRFEADNVTLFVGVALGFLALCLLFVRKDGEYAYCERDKMGIVCNYLVGLIAVPIISIVCIFFGITGGGVSSIDQLVYNIPPVTVICLAFSVALRRKGFSKTSFYIQFGGAVLFALMIVAVDLLGM